MTDCMGYFLQEHPDAQILSDYRAYIMDTRSHRFSPPHQIHQIPVERQPKARGVSP